MITGFTDSFCHVYDLEEIDPKLVTIVVEGDGRKVYEKRGMNGEMIIEETHMINAICRDIAETQGG